MNALLSSATQARSMAHAVESLNGISEQQLLDCTKAFEEQLKRDGEFVSFDENGIYTNILHRTHWRRWLQSWCACLRASPPTEKELFAPRKTDESLLGFLNNCRAAGIFFDGQTAKGKPGIFFVSMKEINEHLNSSGNGMR